MVSSHVMLDNLVSPPSPAQIRANLHPRWNHFVLIGAHDEQTAVQVFPLGGKVFDQHVAGRPIHGQVHWMLTRAAQSRVGERA